MLYWCDLPGSSVYGPPQLLYGPFHQIDERHRRAVRDFDAGAVKRADIIGADQTTSSTRSLLKPRSRSGTLTSEMGPSSVSSRQPSIKTDRMRSMWIVESPAETRVQNGRAQRLAGRPSTLRPDSFWKRLAW